MKTISFILIIMFLLIISTSAQVSKPFNVYLGGGLTSISTPQGFKDDHKLGYNLHGGLGFKMFPFIQLVGKMEYHTFPKDYGDIFAIPNDILNIVGGRRDFVLFGADARVGASIPTAPISPFLFAGFGWARISQSDILSDLDITQTSPLKYDSQTKLYINIGGGLEFKALMLTLFIQGRYLNVKQDGENIVLIPITAGFKF